MLKRLFLVLDNLLSLSLIIVFILVYEDYTQTVIGYIFCPLFFYLIYLVISLPIKYIIFGKPLFFPWDLIIDGDYDDERRFLIFVLPYILMLGYYYMWGLFSVFKGVLEFVVEYIFSFF